MINNSAIRNCTVSHPIVQLPFNDQILGKIEIKNIYQKWNGENIIDIKQKHQDNPYSLRIGMPSTDALMKRDRVYFILHYLSYNPLTKDIENRQIIPLRNTEKMYIGQSIDEKYYKDYRLFVDGNIIADDLVIKSNPALRDTSVSKLLTSLYSMVEKLQFEVANLKRQLQNKDTYKQDTFINESTSTISSRKHTS